MGVETYRVSVGVIRTIRYAHQEPDFYITLSDRVEIVIEGYGLRKFRDKDRSKWIFVEGFESRMAVGGREFI